MHVESEENVQQEKKVFPIYIQSWISKGWGEKNKFEEKMGDCFDCSKMIIGIGWCWQIHA